MYGNGIVEWGNYTAASPATTTPDAFECVRRSLMIMKRSITMACAQFIDVKQVKQADIDLVRNIVNQYYNRLTAKVRSFTGSAFSTLRRIRPPSWHRDTSRFPTSGRPPCLCSA